VQRTQPLGDSFDGYQEAQDRAEDAPSPPQIEGGVGDADAQVSAIVFKIERGGLVDTKAMTPVPADATGTTNDLKDKLESAVVAAMSMEGSIIYAFGSRWGPEENKPDQYFKFVPGNGVHDIHMNQGNSGQYAQDNGAYQDGALMIAYADNTWRAFFFAFQSQTFDTDDQGNPIA